MMRLEMLPSLSLYLKYLNDKLNQPETAGENSYGPDPDNQTVKHMVLTRILLPKNVHSISISYTLEPRTITIQTTSTLPLSNEVSSNTTIPIFSPKEMEDGILKGNA